MLAACTPLLRERRSLLADRRWRFRDRTLRSSHRVMERGRLTSPCQPPNGAPPPGDGPLQPPAHADQ